MCYVLTKFVDGCTLFVSVAVRETRTVSYTTHLSQAQTYQDLSDIQDYFNVLQAYDSNKAKEFASYRALPKRLADSSMSRVTVIEGKYQNKELGILAVSGSGELIFEQAYSGYEIPACLVSTTPLLHKQFMAHKERGVAFQTVTTRHGKAESRRLVKDYTVSSSLRNYVAFY